MSAEEFIEFLTANDGVVLFSAVVSAVMGMLLVYRALLYRDPLADRIQSLNSRQRSLKSTLLAPKSRQRREQTLGFMRHLVQKLNLLRTKEAKKITLLLSRAGFRKNDALVVFFFAKLSLPFIFGGLAILFLYVLPALTTKFHFPNETLQSLSQNETTVKFTDGAQVGAVFLYIGESVTVDDKNVTSGVTGFYLGAEDFSNTDRWKPIKINEAGGAQSQGMTSWLICLAMVVLGGFAPNLFLKNAISKREHKLRRGLPDALDLLVICAEAGQSLDAALKRVSSELGRFSPEIADELLLTSIELGLMPDRRTALDNLVQRANIAEIRNVVNALNQTEKYGTPLAHTLRVLSAEYRSDRMMRAEAKAARLPAVMTVPMIIFILPPLFVVLLGPAILRVLDQFINR